MNLQDMPSISDRGREEEAKVNRAKAYGDKSKQNGKNDSIVRYIDRACLKNQKVFFRHALVKMERGREICPK